MKSFQKLLIAVLTFTVVSLNAQDIHFSQFYMSPLNLNPALTGVMNCNHRIVLNYRNQWASILQNNAFQTYSVSYDQRIPVGRYDYFGVGGSFWGDRAGELDFSTVTGRLSLAYSKRMGGRRRTGGQYLSVGFDAGATQRSIDFQSAIWPEQITFEGIDPTRSSQEPAVFDDQFIFFDMSAGLMWFSVIDEYNNFYIGGAFHHLNTPNVTFYRNTEVDPNFEEVDEALYSRYTVHAGGEFQLADRFSLVPGAVMFLQGPSTMINAGTSARFLLGSQRFSHQSFQLGAWVRMANRFDSSNLLMDAFILSTRLDYDRFGIGFSYDINVSDLRPATSSNGAFEFSLNYKICGPERRGVYCPNF